VVGAILREERFDKLSAERLRQAGDNLIEAEFLGSGFTAISDEEVSSARHHTLRMSSSKP
jgi:hypothetical protein